MAAVAKKRSSLAVPKDTGVSTHDSLITKTEIQT